MMSSPANDPNLKLMSSIPDSQPDIDITAASETSNKIILDGKQLEAITGACR
jgi:hypothetical protein